MPGNSKKATREATKDAAQVVNAFGGLINQSEHVVSGVERILVNIEDVFAEADRLRSENEQLRSENSRVTGQVEKALSAVETSLSFLHHRDSDFENLHAEVIKLREEITSMRKNFIRSDMIYFIQTKNGVVIGCIVDGFARDVSGEKADAFQLLRILGDFGGYDPVSHEFIDSHFSDDGTSRRRAVNQLQKIVGPENMNRVIKQIRGKSIRLMESVSFLPQYSASPNT